MEKNPRSWVAYMYIGNKLKNRQTRAPTIIKQTRTWNDEAIFSLESALRDVVLHFDDLTDHTPGIGPCPVQFTKEENERFARESEKWKRSGKK